MVKQQVSTKLVRRWCRENYGLDWWDCHIDVRKFRKRNARVQILKRGARRVCSNEDECNADE